jgi:glycine cleavage system H protein
MNVPEDLRYTQEHEWARAEKGVVTVGITDYATEQLGDIVFVELPAVGSRVEAMKPFGVVEAVKTVSDLYAPLSGTVAEVNASLADDPAGVNRSPYGEGWMLRIKPDREEDFQRLLSPADYRKVVEALQT